MPRLIPGSDADGMEQHGGDGKAGHVFEPAGVFRHFGAMSVAVEKRKKAQDGDAGRNRQVDRQRHEQAKRHHGGQYAWLDEGHRHMRHAKGRAGKHHADKGRRPCPDRPAALERRPQADGDHHNHMIKAG